MAEGPARKTTLNCTDQTREELTLRSLLPEVARIPPWIEELASRYAISANVQLAMNLCLEEVVSNVIRHGYGSRSDRFVAIRFSMPKEGYFVCLVEDDAPRFDPLTAAGLPILSAGEKPRVGGQGIRLLRQFADELEYEPLATGNRLRMGFSAAGTAARMR